MLLLILFLFIFTPPPAFSQSGEIKSNDEAALRDQIQPTRHSVREQCERKFIENKCHDKINADKPYFRWKYIDCKNKDTYVPITPKCLKGFAVGLAVTAVGEALGIGAEPLLFFYGIKYSSDKDEACALNRERKKEIVHVIQSLISKETYEIYLNYKSCGDLNRLVNQRIDLEVAKISQKISLQKEYDDYAQSGDTIIIDQAETLYPKSKRELSVNENEFLKRLQEKENSNPKMDFIALQKLLQTSKEKWNCASPAYVAEVICNSTGALLGSKYRSVFNILKSKSSKQTQLNTNLKN
ncbi:MAG: hypothetical protein H6623_00725 [Bdellovibrionaceae bacterium]|nr:hypothetical protein [Pseudobdellovibrionaceae bacterium]